MTSSMVKFGGRYRMPAKKSFRMCFQSHVKDEDKLREMVLLPSSISEDVFYYKDSRFLVAYEANPVSNYHLVVYPRRHLIDSVHDLRSPEHVTLLKDMKDFTESMVKGLAATESGAVLFRAGFHSFPVMKQLHMHVFSTDLAFAQTRRCWNMYASRFLVDLDEVLHSVQEDGRIEPRRIPSLNYLIQEPACPRCGYQNQTLMSIKRHALECDFNSTKDILLQVPPREVVNFDEETE